MFCSQCGNTVVDGARFCGSCGAAVGGSVAPVATAAPQAFAGNAQADLVYPSVPPQSPHLALLNLLLPGVAHIIFGQVTKGVVILVLSIVGWITIFLPFVLAIVSVIDGYMVGNALKAGRPVGKWQFFPSA